MSFDPWRALSSEWPGVRVYIRVLPGKWGQTTWDGGTPRIELAHDLGPVQQRVTLTHEIGHLVTGQPCVSFCENNEADVREWTARVLLPDMPQLGRLLRRLDVAQIARKLDVTPDVLADRLATMTDAERDELAGMLPTGDTADSPAAASARRGGPRIEHHCGKIATSNRG